MLRTRYRIDPKRIVHETIDDEAIVIDLETGTYFSLTGSAPEIWRLLLCGWSTDEIADALALDDPEARGGVYAAVSSLVGELRAAGLIEEDAIVARQDTATAGGVWAVPVLQTFTDMEYFLLLDPVHDVQAAGWPHAKAELEL